ncbi:MAG: hypothetical protein JST79_05815 [Acidobacteria bacterium]|nr:hypothetical protein [Acidobacteriota bacterium]
MHTVPKIEEAPRRSRATSALPVLALGGGITLTAVLHLLHRKNIPVYTICAETDFVRHSRLYRPAPGLAQALSPADLEPYLQETILPEAVLLPCSDDWAQAVALLPPELSGRFPHSTSRSQIIETLVDKWRFAQLMETLRLPHPRTRLLGSLEDIAQIPESAFEQAILKPLASVNFSSRFGVKGFLVNSRAEALRRMQHFPFPIMLQEFIPGPPSAGYFLDGFVDRKGRICAMFARQRLRMHPAKLGNSTLMKSVPCGEVAGAVATLEHLLEQIGYRGIFSAEFKFDARDGIFKLFEINARPWWYIEFPALCGVDVCEMAYRDALEQPVSPQMEYAVERHCMFLLDDLRAWRLEHKAGSMGIVAWLRSWKKSEITPFHWRDPLPGLFYAMSQWKRPKRG